MSSSDLPRNWRSIIAIATLLGAGVGFYAKADGAVDDKIEKAQAPVWKRLDKLESKVDKILELLLERKTP